MASAHVESNYTNSRVIGKKKFKSNDGAHHEKKV